MLTVFEANRDCIGAVFTLIGFLLALLTLISNATPSLQGAYFIKLTENPPTDFQITFGLYHYCIQDECIQDKSIMVIPFDERVFELFNETYPQLFEQAMMSEEEGDPKHPPHNPHMEPALILLLVFAGIALLMNLYTMSQQRHLYGYRDVYFSRGFTVLMACTFALLLVILIDCTYQEAAFTKYPQLEATLGPCVPMIGCSFLCLFLASAVLLKGCTT